MVQGGITSSTECGAARLRAKGLDALGLAVLATANMSMDVCACLAVVGALLVGAGEALVGMRLGAPRRLLTSHQG